MSGVAGFRWLHARAASRSPGLRALFALVAAISGTALAADLAPPAAASDDDAARAAEPALVQSVLDRVEAQWWRRKALAAKGDRVAADQATRALIDLMKDEGVARVEGLAQAARLEGERELEHDNYASALAAFQLARQLDPGQAAALWDEATARRRMDQGFWPAMKLRLLAVRTAWSSFWTTYALGTAAIAWLLLAVLIAGSMLIIVQLLRHGPTLAYEIEQRLPARWHPTWRSSVAAAAVLAPAVLLVFGVFGLLCWAVLLHAAASRNERRAVIGWLVVLACAVPLTNAVWVLSSVAASPAARVAVASAQRTLRPDLLAELAALEQAHPQQPTWKILLARLHATHSPDRAVHLLRDAADLAPSDARSRVLLGNLYFRLSKYEMAGVQYREALARAPNDPVTLFNLSKVRFAQNDFPAAEEALGQARTLAKARVAQLEREVAQSDVAEPSLTAIEVARQVLADEAVPGIRGALRLANPVTLAALLALLGCLAVRLRGRPVTAFRCEYCGAPSVPRGASKDRVERDICMACAQLFQPRQGVDPAARQEQTGRVDRHVRGLARARRVTNLIWPGLSQMHEGRTWLGLALASAWVFLLSSALWPERILPIAPGGVPWSLGVPSLVAAGLVWILAQSFWGPLPLAQRGGR